MRVFSILCFIMVTCNSFSQIISSEVYFTPRYPSYGFGDNGLFRFKLNSSTIKRPLIYASYNVDIENLDTINELFYRVIDEKIDFRNYLVDASPVDSIFFKYPRIMMITHYNGLSDTLLIDENFVVKRKNEICELNANGAIFLLNLMPLDIRRNWMVGIKGIKAVRLGGENAEKRGQEYGN